ncbi:neuroglian [Dendroctonus ponderosae]|uniref:neuroglian n=1 Tax=Dendroctonus ponderosae TaxID=77166 RepID=UPI002034F17F|nr:neuroglian [Dendroctonus ponderosae]KAH1003325.1 hypothetical protein HUJ05_011252 [Dendroctonus ponderosae]
MAAVWCFLALFALCAHCSANNRTKLTRELVPLAAPINLTLVGFESRDALISWEPVASESVRGSFRGYIVRIWNHALSQVYAIPPEVTQTAVQFFPYSRNFVTVSVRNDKYVGPRSVAMWFDAPQTEPGMPFHFEHSQLGSQSALLQWRRPAHANGALLGYNIYCSEAQEFGHNAQTTVQEFIQGRDNTQAKITGLKLGQRYLIEVAAVNCAGEGERNTLLVEAEPHQPYTPSRPAFKYTIGVAPLDKAGHFARHCAASATQLDDDSYVLNTVLPQDRCVVQTLIKWVPDVTHNPGEHFFLKYRLKGAADWTETSPELSEDFVVLRDFDACRSYEIILVAVDGDFRTESEPQETPAVLFPTGFQ